MSPTDMPIEPDGLMASSPYNRTAGRLLRDMRKASGLSQTGFATAVSERLGVKVWQTAVSAWELGDRTVPAAALLAAQSISSSSIDDLLIDSTKPSSEAVQREATRQLADTVQQLARLMTERTSPASEAAAVSVLAKARRVRKMLDGTDTSDD